MTDEFRTHYRLRVQFRDIDMFNHVNNATYLSYLEEARLHYYKELSKEDGPQIDSSFILASATVNYRSPAFLGEELDVAIGVRELKTTSFAFHYRITEVSTGRLVADGLLVQVCYDYTTGQKIELGVEMREKVCAFDGLDKCRPD